MTRLALGLQDSTSVDTKGSSTTLSYSQEFFLLLLYDQVIIYLVPILC